MTNMSYLPCPCQPAIQATHSPTDCKSLGIPSYTECCQPLHLGQLTATSAKTLMQSRYSAFVLVLTDYIVATTLPAQQRLLDKSAINRWANQTKWAGLEIIEYLPNLGHRHAQVEFNAYFDSPTGLQSHHELSSFVKIDSKAQPESYRWYFLDPTVSMSIAQNQPCICSSGKKFKRCCGRFI